MLQTPEPDAHELAKSAIAKTRNLEELLLDHAMQTRGTFEEIKRMITTLTDAVLELHQKRMTLASDVGRFQTMNALIAIGCGLFFGWTGALLFAISHR